MRFGKEFKKFLLKGEEPVGIHKILADASGMFNFSVYAWKKGTYTTSSCLRTPSNFMKTYRELQILNANVMNIYSPLALLAAQWLFMAVCILNIYGFIKLSSPFDIIMGVTAIGLLLFLVVLFTILALVEVRSSEVLRSWNYQRQTKILKTFIPSTTSVRVYIGTFYYVDQGMVLMMLKFITECTVDLIVLH
ncbi:unnamed protein product [Allacma fusca]|uniref:Uncharacterized protein n=1 Tax=Allacma fusca TaxID=39272 RepID=A0A8J2K0U1_9HEXA|nr:unnamed protein product [Allacma fusca]